VNIKGARGHTGTQIFEICGKFIRKRESKSGKMEDDTATYLSQTYQPTLFGNNNSKWQFRFELLNTDPVLKIIEYIERNMAIDNNTVRMIV
jgi:hypothetical protein